MKELAKKNKEIKEKEINGDGGESNEVSTFKNWQFLVQNS